MAIQKVEVDYIVYFETKAEWKDFVENFQNFKKEDYFVSKRTEEMENIFKRKVLKENSLLDAYSKKAYPNPDLLLKQMKELEEKVSKEVAELDATIAKKYAKNCNIFKSFELNLDPSKVQDSKYTEVPILFAYENEVSIEPGEPTTFDSPGCSSYAEGLWDESDINEYFELFAKTLGFCSTEYELDIMDSNIESEESVLENAFDFDGPDAYDYYED